MEIIMDDINKIMTVIWQIIEDKKIRNCAVNVHTANKKLVVNIIVNKEKRCFSNTDEKIVLEELQKYLVA